MSTSFPYIVTGVPYILCQNCIHFDERIISLQQKPKNINQKNINHNPHLTQSAISLTFAKQLRIRSCPIALLSSL